MGSMKDYMYDVQSERADKWVREQLNDEDGLVDEDSEEYQSLLQDYADMKQFQSDAAEWEAELEWLKNNGSSILHKEFIEQLNDLREMAGSNLADSKGFNPTVNSRLVINMTYAYAVTLLEAFLVDTLNALLSENPKFLKNAITSIDELKNAKYGLADLYQSEATVLSLATRKLAGIHFHNIPKVKKIYEEVLGVKLSVDFSKVNEITAVRHDIVHRNGKTIDGVPVYINAERLQAALDFIQQFASNLQAEINKATQ